VRTKEDEAQGRGFVVFWGQGLKVWDIWDVTDSATQSSGPGVKFTIGLNTITDQTLP